MSEGKKTLLIHTCVEPSCKQRFTCEHGDLHCEGRCYCPDCTDSCRTRWSGITFIDRPEVKRKKGVEVIPISQNRRRPGV